MSKNLKSLVFAMILAVVCSLLLTAAATGLKSFQQRNLAADRYKNILKAFALVEEGDDLTADKVEEMYHTYVKQVQVDAQGRVIARRQDESALPLYLHVADNAIKGYVLPIVSRGLWGPIHGYLAVEPDGTTVKGFTVYKHQETPGLGGEIENAWFGSDFVGKKILNTLGEFVSIGIAKGRVIDAVPQPMRVHYVNGISGATLTGQYLSAGIREILEKYEPVAERFRRNETNEYLTNPGTGIQDSE